MRILLALFLGAHAVAHLPGFLAGWDLLQLPESPVKPALFGGRTTLGLNGVRAVGVAWLLTGALVAFAAISVFRNDPNAYRLAWVTFVVSGAMTVAGWPDTKIGVLANAVILVALLIPLFVR